MKEDFANGILGVFVTCVPFPHHSSYLVRTSRQADMAKKNIQEFVQRWTGHGYEKGESHYRQSEMFLVGEATALAMRTITIR